MSPQSVTLREYFEALREADRRAVETALTAQQELAAKHNDLIRQMERKDATYATKDELGRIERFQARLMGGMLLLGAIGVANLVKLWT